jgi:peptidylprolyl isomerase
MPSMQRIFLISAVCLLFAVTGCGDSSGSSAGSTSAAEGQDNAGSESWPIVEVGSKVSVPEGPPPKKLVIKELEKGDGPVAKLGDEVEILYVDALYSDGEVVSLAVPGAPFHLKLGAGGSIPGWEKGIVGMGVGGRRELIIPAALAGGEEAHVSTVGLVGIK